LILEFDDANGPSVKEDYKDDDTPKLCVQEEVTDLVSQKLEKLTVGGTETTCTVENSEAKLTT
jgi:hypothetical protein